MRGDAIEERLIVVRKSARTLSLVEHGTTRATFPVLVGDGIGPRE